MNEIIFEVLEDAVDGGYHAHGLGHAIHTQAETLDDLRRMIKDAVNCHFGDQDPERPRIIRLHFVRDELLAG